MFDPGAGDRPSTFLGLPCVDIAALASAAVDLVVLGAPCATPYASVGPYCAAAPAAIRAASAGYAANRGNVDFDLGGPALLDAVAVDAGDVAWAADDGPGNRARITAAVDAVLAAGAVPVVLGGDDSIPIPMIAAFAGRGTFTVLQVDAHIDWRDEVQGERYGLSSTMRRSSEMAHVGTMVQVGRRAIGSARAADIEAATARGVRFFGARDVHRHGIDPVIDAVPAGVPVIVTVDIDGLDPTVAPGVIGPAPGGLWYHQVIDLLDGVAARAPIAAFDVVEFCPPNDVNGITALTAFRLCVHAMGLVARRRAHDAPGRD